MENNDIKSVLNLERLVFDKIEFNRLGFQNDNHMKYQLETSVGKHNDNDIYRVTLVLKGVKEREYTFEISLTGFFSFRDAESLTEEARSHLININTISILMPYLRSQVSLLTAQPGMECVVLPPFNINKIVDSDDSEQV